MNDNNIKYEIINFYNDPLYQELNAYYSKMTIFNILKIERNENRHSAFLAWILDKNIDHGLGDEPLKKLLRFLYLINKVNTYDSCLLSGNYLIENLEVCTEQTAYNDKKYGRIDVYLKFNYRYNTRDKTERKLCVIIETKMYTEEHDNQTERYLKWAHETEGLIKKKEILGVFLAPNKVSKCSGDTQDFEFLKIDYQDLVDNVLEPLLLLDMPQETRHIIQDYVINLEKPVKKRDENDNLIDKQEDTILAISKAKEDVFQTVYKEHSNILDSSIYARNREKNIEQFERVYLVYEDYKKLSDNDCKLLESFWNSNAALLKMIMSSVLENNYNPDGDAELSEAIDVLLDVKKNNRHKTKYVVKDKYGNLMNDLDKGEKAKPAYKSLASYYIFKAWLQDKDNENATLKDIRNAFSVEECAPHYKDTFQYLFYKEFDIEQAIRNCKTERTYFIAELDEDNAQTKSAHKYLTWDFYMDGKHYLQVKNEENGKVENVLNIKYWADDEFNMFIECAKRYGISVVKTV